MSQKTKLVCIMLILVSIFLISCEEDVSERVGQDTESNEEASESTGKDIKPGEVVSHKIDDTLHLFIKGSASKVIPGLSEEPTVYWESDKGFSWDYGSSTGIMEDFEYDGPHSGALEDMKDITKLVTHQGVITIGGHAFSSNYLTEVTIPDSVTKIEWAAFAENILTEVTIPDSVTEIGLVAFASNNLTEVTIPDSVTTIGGAAFAGSNLIEVTIGANVDINPDRDTMGWNRGFKNFYNDNRRQAGTYTWNGESWGN